MGFGCAPSIGDLGYVHGLFHSFVLHQKDISGGKSLARGETPLHFAAQYGHVEAVQLLLEAKASVTVKINRGRGPRLGDVMVLLMAFAYLSYHITLLLLTFSWHVFLLNVEIPVVNSQWSIVKTATAGDVSTGKSLARGQTPLHLAAYNGQVEVVKLLLEAKASVAVKDDNGRGPRLGDVMGVCLLCGSCLCLLTVETSHGEAVIKGF